VTGFGVSDFARNLVRSRVELAMVCQITILRGKLGLLDPSTGKVSGLTDAVTVYEGKARVRAIANGQSVDLGGGEIVIRDTTISIPIGSGMPFRDDLVTVTDGGPDFDLSTRIFRVLGASGGGLFGDARRMSASGWLQSRYWGEQ
jgi:hypothetical protein